VSRADLLTYEETWKARHLPALETFWRASAWLDRATDAELDRLISAWSSVELPAAALLRLASPSGAHRLGAGARFARASLRASFLSAKAVLPLVTRGGSLPAEGHRARSPSPGRG
jgi:hypothetical protein